MVTIDSGELRKVRRLTRHPFRETSKSELYFLPRSFEQKTYAFDANCVNSRFTIMCLCRQANMVLPGENAWSLDVCNKDNVGEKDD